MTQKLTVKININCPACGKRGIIKVEENIIRNTENGITAINVSKNIICEHSFISYIDKNLAVRDCFVCDFKIELPDIKIDMKEMEEDLSFDVDIIKINLLPSMLVNILRATLYGKKIVIIMENDFLKENFIKFFNAIFIESFEWQVTFLPLKVYKKNKKLYKDHIVLESTEVLSDKDNVINQKSIKIEKAIINKFFLELDPHSSIIILRSEIDKIRAFCNEFIKFNNTLREDQEFNIKKALDHLIPIYNVKIQLPYLRFLEDIIIHCFGIELKKTAKTNEFLAFL